MSAAVRRPVLHLQSFHVVGLESLCCASHNTTNQRAATTKNDTRAQKSREQLKCRAAAMSNKGRKQQLRAASSRSTEQHRARRSGAQIADKPENKQQKSRTENKEQKRRSERKSKQQRVFLILCVSCVLRVVKRGVWCILCVVCCGSRCGCCFSLEHRGCCWLLLVVFVAVLLFVAVVVVGFLVVAVGCADVL